MRRGPWLLGGGGFRGLFHFNLQLRVAECQRLRGATIGSVPKIAMKKRRILGVEKGTERAQAR
jgi:hypothetical protein